MFFLKAAQFENVVFEQKEYLAAFWKTS